MRPSIFTVFDTDQSVRHRVGTVKLSNKSKRIRTNRHFPIQQAHVTCHHVSNDRFLSNR